MAGRIAPSLMLICTSRQELPSRPRARGGRREPRAGTRRRPRAPAPSASAARCSVPNAALFSAASAFARAPHRAPRAGNRPTSRRRRAASVGLRRLVRHLQIALVAAALAIRRRAPASRRSANHAVRPPGSCPPSTRCIDGRPASALAPATIIQIHDRSRHAQHIGARRLGDGVATLLQLLGEFRAEHRRRAVADLGDVIRRDFRMPFLPVRLERHVHRSNITRR